MILYFVNSGIYSVILLALTGMYSKSIKIIMNMAKESQLQSLIRELVGKVILSQSNLSQAMIL